MESVSVLLTAPSKQHLFNMKCFVALFALIAVAASQYAAPVPAYGPAPVEIYADVPPAYNYNYGVDDSLSGANFGASEARDGYNTQGEYHVALPDGRIQTVTYTTNGDSGHIADVKYSGEAVYAPAPVPAYGPAPVRVAAPLPAPVAVAAPVFAPAPLAAPVLAAGPAFGPGGPLLRGGLVGRPLLG